MGERVAVQVHRDRLQYVFGTKALGAVAIVDWESVGLRGLYGYRHTADAIERAWERRYARDGAQIVMREAKQWNRLIRWICWR